VTSPRLSVIVPAHAASDDFARCLDALHSSDLPKDDWELIVVDDASEAHAVTRSAAAADQVVSLEQPASGPARARNEGVAVARGGIVAFVDADVLVHRDALRLLLSAFDDPAVTAAFGSYDDQPEHQGITSQYRNLLHHRVHQRSAGRVESFWAGIGAVRRSAFDAAGGFDAETYRRPEMEDVELGYRLRDAGHVIVLDSRIQGTHLKRWTLPGMVASDFARRGIPWARLLARRKMLLSPRGLSLGTSERASAAFALMSFAAFVVALLARSTGAAVAGLASLALFLAANCGLLRWFARQRGFGFAIVAVPLHFIYSINAVVALAAGAASAIVSRRNAQGRYTRRQ
jgi:GT2 family glycosyltransferase